MYDYVDVVLNPAFGAVDVADTLSARAAGSSWSAPLHVWTPGDPGGGGGGADGRRAYTPVLVEDRGTRGLGPLPIQLDEMPTGTGGSHEE
jgi:hypothetical protein